MDRNVEGECDCGRKSVNGPKKNEVNAFTLGDKSMGGGELSVFEVFRIYACIQ
jgi:hypothetical protein